MPELKPCPACGSDNVECLVCTINADENQDVHFHIACEDCYTSGPIADNGKIAADEWNSLPRRPDYNDVDCAGCPERRHSALTWTTEPPKVVGRFWWRDDRHPNEADILNVTQTTLEWFQHNRLCPHEQFAGPIPEPKE